MQRKGNEMVLITADQSPAPASSALCSKGSIADGYLSSGTVPPKYYVDDKVAMPICLPSFDRQCYPAKEYSRAV